MKHLNSCGDASTMRLAAARATALKLISACALLLALASCKGVNNPDINQLQEPPSTVSVTGVLVTPSKLTLTIPSGNRPSATLEAKVLPSNATNKNVMWQSSAPDVATVDANGKVTSGAVGTATITVKTDDGGKTATCEVTVTDKNLTETSYTVRHWLENIDNSEYTEKTSDKIKSYAGDETTATAKEYIGFDAEPIQQQTVKEDGSTVINIYYKRKIITITLNLAGGQLGTGTTLTGKYGANVPLVADPTKDGYVFNGWTPPLPDKFERNTTCSAQWVDKAAAVDITNVSLPSTLMLSMNNRTSASIAAAILPANATNTNITWTSSDQSIATIDNWNSGSYAGNSKYYDARVYAANVGTATITATIGGKSASCTVTVIAEDVKHAWYTVEHWYENTEDDDFTQDDSDTRTTLGYVGDETQAHALTRRHNTAIEPIEQKIIAEDNSTVVKVYYKKHRHTINLLVDGLLYKTATGKYGAPCSFSGTPTKDGYEFIGWNPPLPTSFEKDMTCEAVFVNPTADALERAKALLVMPQYNNESYANQTFMLASTVDVDGKTVNVSWEAQGIVNGGLSGTYLTISRDIVPQNITITATLSYGDSTTTKTQTYAIAVPVIADGDSTWTFTPGTNGTTGTLTRMADSHSSRMTYNVDTATKTITVTKTHISDDDNTKWLTKSQYETEVKQYYNNIIAAFDTFHNNKTFENYSSYLLATTMHPMVSYGISKEELEEDLKYHMVDVYNEYSGSMVESWTDLTPAQQEEVLNIEYKDAIKDLAYMCNFSPTATWAELKAQVNAIVEQAVNAAFQTNAPYTYTLSFSYDEKLEFSARAKWIDDKTWNEQNGYFSKYDNDTRIRYYMYTNYFSQQTDTTSYQFYGTWNSSYTQYTVSAVSNNSDVKTASGTLSVIESTKDNGYGTSTHILTVPHTRLLT